MMGLFSFSGRTTRLGFLGVGFLQLALIGGMVILAVAMGIGMSGGKPSGSGLMAAIAIMFFGSILTLWVGLACTTRRLRDMGWPVLYGLIGLFFINVVAGLLVSPLAPDLTQPPALQPGRYTIQFLASCAASFVLLLWPSARRANFDDIEEMFGGDAVEPEPSFTRDPEPAFARPAFTAQPVQSFSRADPSQPRAQFGLRGIS